jgi:2-octaprenyl-6-methoxyphenol hydroxylase
MKTKSKRTGPSAHKSYLGDIYDAAIIGGGFIGMAMANALGRAGIRTVCIDQARKGDFSLRTTAISEGSRRILLECGLWHHVKNPCPIRGIEVLEGNSPVLLNLGGDEKENLGWVVMNEDLGAAMQIGFESHANLSFMSGTVMDFEILPQYAYVHLNDGGKIKSKIVIGADGRNSFVRDWMGVPVRKWDYRQRAILTTVWHQKPHNNIAIEHFLSAGPFAVLPMPDDENSDHRSAVIITEDGPKSKSWMLAPDYEFESAIIRQLPRRLGKITRVGNRASYPLSFIHAGSYIGPRMALIGDAAHGIHPIAAQGLNLGFKDVKELTGLIVSAHKAGRDVGGGDVLNTYDQTRRPGNTVMAAATDAMNRIFTSRSKAMTLIRSAGIKWIGRNQGIKKFIIKQGSGR